MTRFGRALGPAAGAAIPSVGPSRPSVVTRAAQALLGAILVVAAAGCQAVPPVMPSPVATATATPGGSSVHTSAPATAPATAVSATPTAPATPSATAAPPATATPTAVAPTVTPASAPTLPVLFPLPDDLVPDPGFEGITVSPATAHSAQPGQAYSYQLGHCGILSPIDFDGNLWDPIGAQDGKGGALDDHQIGELINSSEGTMTLVGPNSAVYRTSSGLILGLTRHPGPKDYVGCR